MIIPTALIDFLVVFGGIFLALLTMYFILKKNLERFLSLKNIELNKEIRVNLLPLRLQAHERLIIFVDRINPANMLLRVHQPDSGIAALQAAVLTEVRSEYQHNIAQQLYINASTWQVVSKLKDDTIAMINNGVQGLGNEASGMDLSKAVLDHMVNIEENPYDLTIGLIKQEIHQLF